MLPGNVNSFHIPLNSEARACDEAPALRWYPHSARNAHRAQHATAITALLEFCSYECFLWP